jgi:hypothetical protein
MVPLHRGGNNDEVTVRIRLDRQGKIMEIFLSRRVTVQDRRHQQARSLSRLSTKRDASSR